VTLGHRAQTCTKRVQLCTREAIHYAALKVRSADNRARFLYVPLPAFGCLLTVFAALPGFKLLQPVAGSPEVERLLQSVPNVLQTVTTKNIPQFLCEDPSAKTYRVRA
jgi:hypothetical protein